MSRDGPPTLWLIAFVTIVVGVLFLVAVALGVASCAVTR